MKTYYMNKMTGELLTFSEMMEQFKNEYDGFDETNMIWPDEYYEKVEV